MHLQRRSAYPLLAAAATTAAITLAACGTPGGSGDDDADGESTASDTTQVTAEITAEEVAELGDVTLSVWADQGEEEFMGEFIPAYEDAYPNVTVEIQYKSFNDLTATVLNAMNSEDAPDVTQGNQGWATDGALVKAGLIRPLDDLATAYGYQSAAGDSISQLQWSSDGTAFGTGSIFGLSPDNQMVGMFYNKQKLDALGLEVPRTLADLDAALATASSAGETPLMLGNSDKAAAMQALSLIQGALTPAEDTRNWITGADGATFDVPTNAEALDHLAGWVASGYVSAGYDGTSPDDAAANFAAGDGVFFIGGNWYAGTISDGGTFGFAAGLEDGNYASSGSFGLPWHVGANSQEEIAALAFVGMLNAADTAQMLADVNRVPIHTVSSGAAGSVFPDLLTASAEQLEGGGPLYWYDWATDTMFDTFTSGLQSVMAGQDTSADLLTAVQDDWASFHSN